MSYLVIDNYMNHKDKYLFDELKSAFQFMIKLRRIYRELHACDKKLLTIECMFCGQILIAFVALANISSFIEMTPKGDVVNDAI